jgi:DNA-binding GntR family transcriptional regulator
MSVSLNSTLADRAFDELRARILSGRLAGGRRLLPEELAADLDISPTPVKAALRQLEANGLVEIHARRGARVRSFSAQDVDDVYAARDIIEPGVAIEAIRRGGVTPDLLAAVDETIGRLAGLIEGRQFRDVAGAVAADGEFHRLIAEASGNRILVSIQCAIADQAHLIRYFSSSGSDVSDTIAEHRAIRDALASGDAPAAAQASRRHIRAARQRVVIDMGGEPPSP